MLLNDGQGAEACGHLLGDWRDGMGHVLCGLEQWNDMLLHVPYWTGLLPLLLQVVRIASFR